MKKKVLFYFVSIFFFLLLQTTLLRYVAIDGIRPNILAVFVIVAALLRGHVEGGVAGFFAGLSVDMSFGNALGLYALLGLYLGVAAGLTNKRLFRDNMLVVVFFTFAYSSAYESLVYVANNIMSGSMDYMGALTRYILPEAFYNSIIAPAMLPFLKKAENWFDGTSRQPIKY